MQTLKNTLHLRPSWKNVVFCPVMGDPQAQRVSAARRERLAEFRNSTIDSCGESGAIAGSPFLPENIGDCLGCSEQYCSH
jgi:hypothetical protein